MKQGEARNIDYISRVFSKFPAEKQEKILKTARGLLQIQDKGTCPGKKKRKAKNENS
jgi:hypothetical protein